MNGFDYFIGLVREEGPGGFSLFGVEGHGSIAVDLCKDVDVSFPYVLFMFELFKEKSHKYSQLRLYAFLYFL